MIVGLTKVRTHILAFFMIGFFPGKDETEIKHNQAKNIRGSWLANFGFHHLPYSSSNKHQ